MKLLRNIVRFLIAIFGACAKEIEEWDGYDHEQNMED